MLICQWFDHEILVVKIEREVRIVHNRATYTSSGCSIEFVNEFVEHHGPNARTLDQ